MSIKVQSRAFVPWRNIKVTGKEQHLSHIGSYRSKHHRQPALQGNCRATHFLHFLGQGGIITALWSLVMLWQTTNAGGITFCQATLSHCFNILFTSSFTLPFKLHLPYPPCKWQNHFSPLQYYPWRYMFLCSHSTLFSMLNKNFPLFSEYSCGSSPSSSLFIPDIFWKPRSQMDMSLQLSHYSRWVE